MQEWLPQLPESWAPYTSTPYIEAILIGLVVLLLVVIVLLNKRWSKDIIPFKAKGGRIEMKPSSLRGILNSVSGSVEGVERVRSKYWQKGRKLGVKLWIQLHVTARLEDVETELKHRIRQTMKTQLGMDEVDPIHIKVTKIVGAPQEIIPIAEAAASDRSEAEPAAQERVEPEAQPQAAVPAESAPAEQHHYAPEPEPEPESLTTERADAPPQADVPEREDTPEDPYRSTSR